MLLTMVLIKITMTSLPEKRKEVLQTLRSMLEAFRLEKGCRNYQVFQCIEDENVFCLVGEWDTREDLEQHMRSDRFGALLGTKILLKENQDIQIHAVSHTEGRGIVNAARGKSV